MSTDFDIAIAGAGLTGRLMALALAHQGFSVALIDPVAGGGGVQDGRTTALAYAGIRLLKRLDVWDPLAEGAAPIRDILVTNGTPADRFRKGGVRGGALHFPATLIPEDRSGPDGTPLGMIIENERMNETFEAAVQAHEVITDFYGDSVAEVEAGPGSTQLTLASGKILSVSLLIGCDGKFSRLRDRFGMRTLRRDYGQKALICNIGHDRPHEGVAHEMFYPAGPFAILPMTDNRSSIVWTERNETADSYMAMDEKRFMAALRARVGDHLGDLHLASDRAIYPLTFLYAPTPVADRFALAGDAAHTIHPIAGQGFNLGIKDVAALAGVLEDARQTGLDIGHGAVLDRYVRWRRFDTASLALGTDMLNRLFSNDIAPVRWARSLGLGLTQKIDPARTFFMRQAGADMGELPPLMQPLPA